MFGLHVYLTKYAGDEQFYSWTSFLMVLQLLHFDTWFEVNMKCC